MYASLLSVLLLGMVPVWGMSTVDHSPIGTMAIASPSPLRSLPMGHLSASGVLIVDVQSGQEVFARDSNGARPMASLTKLMTALLIVENHALDEWVRVPGDLGELNGNIAHLPTGHEFTVGDLLSALLTASANDAAETLARFHSGSVEAFVAEMNARAEVLGLKRTHYANVAGFDDPDQWSSPRDVAWLALFAFRHPPIAQRLSQRGAQIRSRQGVMLSLTHTHAFLHASTPVVAGKTGTTNGAGQCLLSFVEAGGRQYLVVLLNSQARYVDLRVVLDALPENQKAA